MFITKRILLLSIATWGGFFSSPASAEYLRTGPADAIVSKWLGFSQDRWEISYVSRSNGDRFHFPRSFHDVDEFSSIEGSRGNCTVYVSLGSSPIQWVLDFFREARFFGVRKGTSLPPEEINPMYIQFNCLRR